MTSEARDAAAIDCPTCHARTLPDPTVYSVVACYTCDTCGHQWSARLRNGRPDVRLYPASTIARVSEDLVSPLTEWPRSRHDEHRTCETVPPRELHERLR